VVINSLLSILLAINLALNTINPLLKDFVVAGITIIGAILVVRVAFYLLRRTTKRWDMDLTVVQVLQDIIKYSIYIIAAALILKEMGIDVSAIVLSLGIAGVAVGFGAREVIANFISGLFILGDKSFKVGDTIEISNKKGKVTKVGFRTTTLTTPNNSIITVPNSAFSTNPYVNYTYTDRRRVDLNVTLPYEINLEKIGQIFEDEISTFHWVIKDPKPNMLIKELSDVGITVTLTAWTDEPWKVAKYRSFMAADVKKILEKENE
jgi:small conductance mechanosensitive channel